MRRLFGYVRPCRPEMRVKELDAYKAVYCGLCGQLGRSYGPLARLTLSYDFAFLSMLYWAVNEEKPQVAVRRCFVNPLKKIPVCTGGKGLETSADAAAILLYYKLLDNLRDGGVLAAAGGTLAKPFVAGVKRKAAARLPEQEALIALSVQKQNALEKERCESIDAACEPTAGMIGGLCALLSGDAGQKRVLERLGYLLGRCVYLCDALDDLEKDVRAGAYNPIALRYGLTKTQGDWEGAHGEAAASLYMTIGETEKTLALLHMNDFAPIIENIIPLGLRATVDEIIAKKKETKR